MLDYKKVFDAFRNCVEKPKCADCPWEECEDFDCERTDIPVNLGLNVLEMLNEKKPVDPIAQLDRDEDYIFLCSNCNGEIFGGDVLHDNYCAKCGRMVNWNGRY